MEDELASTVADHGEGSGGRADLAGEELAGNGYVHFRDDVVVGGSFGDDAAENGGGFGGTSPSAEEFGQAEINEEKLLLLVPVFEAGWIGVSASDALVAAGDDFEQVHAVEGIADQGGIGDQTEVDDGQQGAVDVV